MSHEFLDEKEKKVLELDARREIYNIVKKFAGIHFREIERKSNLASGTVKYNLSCLARHGLVKERKEGNTLRYFPKEFKPDNNRVMAFLRQRSIRSILLFILANPDCNHEQIVEAVNLSPSTVSWHLKKLQENGIIGFIKKGTKTFYKILIDKNEIVSLLITYKESFFDSVVDNIVEMWENV